MSTSGQCGHANAMCMCVFNIGVDRVIARLVQKLQQHLQMIAITSHRIGADTRKCVVPSRPVAHRPLRPRHRPPQCKSRQLIEGPRYVLLLNLLYLRFLSFQADSANQLKFILHTKMGRCGPARLVPIYLRQTVTSFKL